MTEQLRDTAYFYRILGVPRPLQRPRICGKNKLYDPQKGEKQDFAFLVKSQHVHDGLFAGPLSLDVVFYFPIPTYLSKAKASELVRAHHDKKPDTSNLIKFVEDALNKVLYNDDAQIAKITAYKCYSDIPRTEFTIKKL